MALVLYTGDGGTDAPVSLAGAPPPRIDMDKLLRTRRNRNHRKNAVYCEVLRLCHRRIQFMANRLQTWCVFKIPSFVPGLPRFNLDACTRFVCSKLRQNGFDLTFVPPQTLMVSWKRHEDEVRGRAVRKRTQATTVAAASTAFYGGGGGGGSAYGGGGRGGYGSRKSSSSLSSSSVARGRRSAALSSFLSSSTSGRRGQRTLTLGRSRSHLDAPPPRFSALQRRPPPRPPAFETS